MGFKGKGNNLNSKNMKIKEIEALESYFKTENEHWNSYTFKMLCEVLQKGEFDNLETPLHLFSLAIDLVIKKYKTPLKAVQSFSHDIGKEKLSPTQKLFVYSWVLKYLNNSEFEKADTDEIKDLLKSQTERLKVEVQKLPENNKPLVGDMRHTLKGFVQKELERLPETFKDLEPMQKFTILSKLMPYVFPKVETISSKEGEPYTLDW
jgi:hypothetical protein